MFGKADEIQENFRFSTVIFPFTKRIPWNFIEFYGILWNSMKLCRILWNYLLHKNLKLHKISYIQKLHKNLLNSVKFHVKYSTEFYVIPGNSTEFQGIPRKNSKEFHGIPRKNMEQFHIIPRNSVCQMHQKQKF